MLLRNDKMAMFESRFGSGLNEVAVDVVVYAA